MDIINERLYDFSANGLCGVFITEKIMKRLLKLSIKYENEVRKILAENKDELRSSNWTMAWKKSRKDTDAVYIKYVLRNDNDVDHRITLFKPAKPKYIEEVFLVDSRKEAEDIAWKRYNDTYGDGSQPQGDIPF
jgi:hypothetical protein